MNSSIFIDGYFVTKFDLNKSFVAVKLLFPPVRILKLVKRLKYRLL